MSAWQPWHAMCFRRRLGPFVSLDEAKAAADRASHHAEVRASVWNSQTGERWFRGRGGWTMTAPGVAQPARAVRNPAEVDRD